MNAHKSCAEWFDCILRSIELAYMPGPMHRPCGVSADFERIERKRNKIPALWRTNRRRLWIYSMFVLFGPLVLLGSGFWVRYGLFWRHRIYIIIDYKDQLINRDELVCHDIRARRGIFGSSDKRKIPFWPGGSAGWWQRKETGLRFVTVLCWYSFSIAVQPRS